MVRSRPPRRGGGRDALAAYDRPIIHCERLAVSIGICRGIAAIISRLQPAYDTWGKNLRGAANMVVVVMAHDVIVQPGDTVGLEIGVDDLITAGRAPVDEDRLPPG